MKKIVRISLILLLIDQLSKIYIKTNFRLDENIEVFKWFNIHFTENPGMAYGVQWGGFAGKIGLTLIRIILITFIAYFIHKWSKKINKWQFYVPAALIFAGAVGNLLDSMFYGILFDTGTHFDKNLNVWMGYEGVSQLNFKGYAPLFGGCVVDMLSFPMVDTTLPDWLPFWGGERFRFFNYIFNAADSYITIGGIIVAYFFFFKPKVYPDNIFK